METPRVRILLIDDDEDQYIIVRRYLKTSHSGPYEIVWASTIEKALKAIGESTFDLCLLDYHLGERTGIELLGEMRASGVQLPVILLTGLGSLEMEIDAREKGASDFLEKGDLNPVLLERSVRYAIENHRAQVALKQTNAELAASLRQIEEDQAAARRIQFQLMPEERLSRDGYQFEHFLKTSAYLSGDFLDYFKIDDDHLGIYIADVSGHGVSSALVTVLLKSTIDHLLDEYRQGENDTILQPARVLAAMNDMILQQDLDKYLTMFYIVVSEQQHSLTVSNAGHFPFPILYDGETARFIEDENLPVGLFADATYNTTTLQLPPKFVLAMFSDGVLEGLQQKSLKEKQDFLLSLVDGMDVTVDSLIAKLGLKSIEAPVDDITLLVARKGV